jgi:hypothetical protein
VLSYQVAASVKAGDCGHRIGHPPAEAACSPFNGLGVGINDIPTSIHEIVELLLERRDLDVCVFEIVLKLL